MNFLDRINNIQKIGLMVFIIPIILIVTLISIGELSFENSFKVNGYYESTDEDEIKNFIYCLNEKNFHYSNNDKNEIENFFNHIGEVQLLSCNIQHDHDVNISYLTKWSKKTYYIHLNRVTFQNEESMSFESPYVTTINENRLKCFPKFDYISDIRGYGDDFMGFLFIISISFMGLFMLIIFGNSNLNRFQKINFSLIGLTIPTNISFVYIMFKMSKIDDDFSIPISILFISFFIFLLNFLFFKSKSKDLENPSE